MRMTDTPRATAKWASRWQLALALLLGALATVVFFVVSGIINDVSHTKRHHTQKCLAEIAKSWVVGHSDHMCPGSRQLQTECGPGEAMTDYWGHEIAVVCSPGVGIAAASSGVDGRWHTDDDIARTHLWHGGQLPDGEADHD